MDILPQTKRELLGRLGERQINEFLSELPSGAGGLDRLTESEAKYLLRFNSLASVRNRIASGVGGGVVGASALSSDKARASSQAASTGALAATAAAAGVGMASPYMFNQAQPSAFWDGALSAAGNALDMPSQGVYGLMRGGYGVLSGEGDPMAQAARVAQQPIDQTSQQFGDWIFDRTKSPAGAALGYGVANLWGPI